MTENQVEEWKEITDYPGYSVSNMGRIKSYRRYPEGKISTLNHSRNNITIALINDDGQRIFLVKKIVATEFIPNPNNYKFIANIDNDITNNKADNLIWKDNRKVKITKEKVKKPSVKKQKSGNYISGKELTREILISQAQGYLTRKAEKMLILMVERIQRKFTYHSEEVKYDVYSYAILNLLLNWWNFDIDKSNNSFAFFTEIIKRGLAAGLKESIGKFKTNSGYKQYSFDDIIQLSERPNNL